MWQGALETITKSADVYLHYFLCKLDQEEQANMIVPQVNTKKDHKQDKHEKIIMLKFGTQFDDSFYWLGPQKQKA